MDGKKRSEYVLRLFSESVSVTLVMKTANNVPADFSVAFTGNVDGKIGSKTLSVVASGIMEGSEIEKMTLIMRKMAGGGGGIRITEV